MILLGKLFIWIVYRLREWILSFWYYALFALLWFTLFCWWYFISILIYIN